MLNIIGLCVGVVTCEQVCLVILYVSQMLWISGSKYILNNKVLLRERKRHTARRVSSTPIQLIGGYPIQSWPGGTPILT